MFIKKLTILIFITIGISSCAIFKRSLRFEIKPTLVVHGNDSTYINELRINRVPSAMYSGELMYSRYGKWDKEVWTKGGGLILVWEKRKLIESQNKLYSIATDGEENWEGMFASVVIFDLKNRDCLTETSEDRNSLLKYFKSAVKNRRRNVEFYDLWHKTRKEHWENDQKAKENTPIVPSKGQSRSNFNSQALRF